MCLAAASVFVAANLVKASWIWLCLCSGPMTRGYPFSARPAKRAQPKKTFRKSREIELPRGRRLKVEHLSGNGLPGRAITAVLPQWPLWRRVALALILTDLASHTLPTPDIVIAAGTSAGMRSREGAG